VTMRPEMSCARAVVVLRAACAAGAIAVLAGAGGCGKSRAQADAATAAFRAQQTSGRFVDMHRAAAPEFRDASSEAEFVKLMELVSRRLGAWRSSKATGWFTSSGTKGRIIRLTYDSQFEKGTAVEVFNWRIEGDGAVLLGYNINSRALLAD